jgi:hypothetical protein
MTTRASFGGTAVGSGCARGNVCIVRSPAEGLAIAAGDVLVAPSTDPAWTPLFLKVGALIMETAATFPTALSWRYPCGGESAGHPQSASRWRPGGSRWESRHGAPSVIGISTAITFARAQTVRIDWRIYSAKNSRTLSIHDLARGLWRGPSS